MGFWGICTHADMNTHTLHGHTQIASKSISLGLSPTAFIASPVLHVNVIAKGTSIPV